MNKKVRIQIIAFVPILIVLLIQWFDKENKYQFIQYIILIITLISLVVYRLVLHYRKSKDQK